MSSRRSNFLVSGAIAGAVIVAGELVLNGWLLLPEWTRSLESLNLSAPQPSLILAGFLKLFLLGYVLVWLYDVFAQKHGDGTRAVLLSGGLIAGLIWVWVMLGMLIAGYVTWTIAWVTMLWGIVELPLAVALAARFRRTRAG